MKSDLEIWNNAAEHWSKLVSNSSSLRTVQLQSATEALLTDLSGKKVLDAGCGEGIFTKFTADHGAEATGIDGAREMVTKAKQNYPNLNFQIADLLQPLPFTNQVFDLVLASMVLMHLKNAETFVGECKRTLKPKGFFIFSVLHPCFNFPTMSLYKSFMDKLFFRKPSGLSYNYYQKDDSRRFESSLNQQLTHYHRTLEDYSKLLSDNGFVITKIVEPHELPAEFLKTHQKVEYVTRLPRFLLIKAQAI